MGKVRPKVDSTLIGPAGEHLVLSRLLAQGFLASPAPRGTRQVDIVVNFIEGGNPKLIQVKTTMGSPKKGWILQAKHENQASEDLFFCFVSFDSIQGEVYVIPSAVVAGHIKEGHEKWLSKPGKQGQKHNDSAMRNLSSLENSYGPSWLSTYFENWDLLR